MPQVVPSMIVDYISRAFPSIEKQIKGEVISFDIPYTHAGKLMAISSLVNQIPGYLNILEGEDFVAYQAALGEIDHVLTAWNAGSIIPFLRETGGVSDYNPVTILFSLLKKCPDEGVHPETSDLSFIVDKALRKAIRIDICSANQAFINSEWKAATVLSGSILEALLLWAISDREKSQGEIKTKTINKLCNSKILTKKPHRQIERWCLNEYILIASGMGIISVATQKQCELTKDFRNLIHPGRAKRLGQTCFRGTAMSALAAVELIIQDFKNEESE